MLVSALSQMWVFALYELLRQWRERRHKVKKWFENGGIQDKIQHLTTDDGDLNVAKNIRRRQLENYKHRQEIRDRLDAQFNMIEPVFKTIELYRMNLAKYCAPGKNNFLPSAPGYGRINMLCGAMDYELINQDGSYYILNRRDIADALREVFVQL